MSDLVRVDRPRYLPVRPADETDPRTGRVFPMKSPATGALMRAFHTWRWQEVVQSDDPRPNSVWVPDWPAWGVVLPQGLLDLDFDIADGVSSWARFQEAVGRYGSADFPRSLLTRTPSGGAHWTGRIPAGVEIVSAAHNAGRTIGGEPCPVDTRVGGRGYAIIGGSVTAAGRYDLVDRPAGEIIPTLTPRMLAALAALGYIRGIPSERDRANAAEAALHARPRSVSPVRTGETPWRVTVTMGPGATHDPLVAEAMRIAGTAAKHGRSPAWVADAFRRLRDAVPAEHMAGDPDDFDRAVRSACERAGIPAPALA